MASWLCGALLLIRCCQATVTIDAQWWHGWCGAFAPRRRPRPVSPTPSAAGPPPASEEPPAPSESPASPISWTGLDRLGFIQSLGGLVLGLIALFSSYDPIPLIGRTLQLQRQWGIPLIVASVATVFNDAQLATRSRLGAAQDAARAEEEAARERD